MSTRTVRELPRGTVLAVAGVSFRQEQVQRVVEGDYVRIIHNPSNEHDSNACGVYTESGELLGFVPKSIAGRLSVPHPGGQWRAEVTEVLRGETWGLRVRLGPLAGDTGATGAVLRHRGDGVTESRSGLTRPVPADTATSEERGPACRVFAKSGRFLGHLLSAADGRVAVTTATGLRAVFPAAVVRIEEPAACV